LANESISNSSFLISSAPLSQLLSQHTGPIESAADICSLRLVIGLGGHAVLLRRKLSHISVRRMALICQLLQGACDITSATIWPRNQVQKPLNRRGHNSGLRNNWISLSRR